MKRVTINGRPVDVSLDKKSHDKPLKAAALSRLLAEAEEDIAAGRIRRARVFLREFKNSRKMRK